MLKVEIKKLKLVEMFTLHMIALTYSVSEKPEVGRLRPKRVDA